MAGRLEGAARAAALDKLEGWREAEGRDAICRSYSFGDFRAAFAFMEKVAVYAEVVDHHPEWCNVYGRVDVTLTSHDVEGLSQRDVALARFMDRAALMVAKEKR